MNTNKSVYITIGRNVDGNPMSTRRWVEFQKNLLAIANEHGIVITKAVGTGNYAGYTENAFVVVLSMPVYTKELRRRLKVLAYLYEQDSIAFTMGTVEFLKG